MPLIIKYTYNTLQTRFNYLLADFSLFEVSD